MNKLMISCLLLALAVPSLCIRLMPFPKPDCIVPSREKPGRDRLRCRAVRSLESGFVEE
jgi:hypothetical protein